MATSNEKNLAFTLVADEGDLGYQTQDLRAALEKGTDELKLDTLRRIIVSTLNGQPQVSSPLLRLLLAITANPGTCS
jgi:coatomer subunit beta